MNNKDLSVLLKPYLNIMNLGTLLENSGFDTDSITKSYLSKLLNTNFPKGIKNIPENVVLFTYLSIENITEFNKKFTNPIFFEKYFINDEILDYNFAETENKENLYVFTIEVAGKNIDIESTLSARLQVPIEQGIILKENATVKILNIEKYFSISKELNSLYLLNYSNPFIYAQA